MESLDLKEVVKCDLFTPTVTLEVERRDKKEIVSLPSGVTASILGLDIDVNLQGNNMLNFGPYFLKNEIVKVFDMASHRGLPMARFLGNFQCYYNKNCIIVEDSCKCEPATHDCMCESSNITERGIALPLSRGPFTVYQQQDNEGNQNIMIKDVSTDRISLTMITTEEEKEIFTSDQCEIKSIHPIGCVGRAKGGNVKVEYVSEN